MKFNRVLEVSKVEFYGILLIRNHKIFPIFNLVMTVTISDFYYMLIMAKIINDNNIIAISIEIKMLENKIN